jgi:hypothetical protein
VDELKQALADAEQAHIDSAFAKDIAEQAYYKAVMAQADALAKLDAAKGALLAAVVGESV